MAMIYSSWPLALDILMAMELVNRHWRWNEAEGSTGDGARSLDFEKLELRMMMLLFLQHHSMELLEWMSGLRVTEIEQ